MTTHTNNQHIEAAKEIIEMFAPHTHDWERAKKCALIHIDLSIEYIEPLAALFGCKPMNLSKIKEEIQKL